MLVALTLYVVQWKLRKFCDAYTTEILAAKLVGFQVGSIVENASFVWNYITPFYIINRSLNKQRNKQTDRHAWW